MRRSRIILWAVLLSVGALIAGFLVVERLRFDKAVRDARTAFRSSRAGDPGSYPFISHGVTAGMSVTEVDRMMAGTKGEGFIDPEGRFLRVYVFEYPGYHNPFTGREDSLVMERYEVFFAADQRATHMTRHVYFKRGRDVKQRIDLTSQRVEEKP